MQKCIEPVLTGRFEKLCAFAAGTGIDISPYRMIATAYSHKLAARCGTLRHSDEIEAQLATSLSFE